MPWKNDQVTEKETEEILAAARALLFPAQRSSQASDQTPPDLPSPDLGDFVEFGCYRGDTSLLLAEILKDFNSSRERATSSSTRTQTPSDRTLNSHKQNLNSSALNLSNSPRLWLYDSFEGLPEKTAPDRTEKSPEFTRGALAVSKRELKLRFLHANLPVPIIKKAWFSDLTPSDLPEKISFAFLDGDFYESIKTSLTLVYPHLTTTAKIIIHDYKNDKLPGVRQATDEFFASHSLQNSQTLLKL